MSQESKKTTKKESPPFKAELLPLGVRAGLVTEKHTQNTTYLLKIFETRDEGEGEGGGEDGSKVEHQILMDTGSRRILKSEFVDPNKLRALFLSHGHLDHTIYLGLFLRKIRKTRKDPLLVICHQNAWNSLIPWIRLFCGRIPKNIQLVPVGLTINHPHLKEHDKENTTDLTQVSTMEPIPLSENLVMDIKVAPALHCISSVVYRLNIHPTIPENTDSPKLSCLDFMFSPDTSYTSDYLVPFAQDAKYWLLDSGFLKETIDEYYDKYLRHEKKGEIVCHSGPYYSGKICQAANVETYLVGHYVWPRFADKFEDVEDAIIKRVRQTYHGNVIVTFDLQPIPLDLVYHHT